MESPPALSRALLLPGPQPPLSHFGATLLRQVVATGLRFALHSLGAPMPEGAPVRIIRLRLYLDLAKLEPTLNDAPAGAELAAALLDPGGTSALPLAAAARGAATFHRARLRLRSAADAPPPSTTDSPGRLLLDLRQTVGALQPALNDALLGELLASLARRAARSKGRALSPCLGRQALALRTGKSADLSSLGIADPFVTAWSESAATVAHVAGRFGELPAAGGHRLRGRFRELYRRSLNPIRAAYLRLAASARERGLIEGVGDAFFIPFDLAEDLAGDGPVDWLPPTLAKNRAEYQSLAEADGVPESLSGKGAPPLVDDRNEWALAPVWPLD